MSCPSTTPPSADQVAASKAEIDKWIAARDTVDDDFHRHFENLALAEWLDVRDEGRRLLGAVLDTPIEKDSALDQVISSVAAAGYTGAMIGVARALGIEVSVLNCAVAEWSEPAEPPDAVGLDGFAALIRQEIRRQEEAKATRHSETARAGS
jgi:hypothetical protein